MVGMFRRVDRHQRASSLRLPPPGITGLPRETQLTLPGTANSAPATQEVEFFESRLQGSPSWRAPTSPCYTLVSKSMHYPYNFLPAAFLVLITCRFRSFQYLLCSFIGSVETSSCRYSGSVRGCHRHRIRNAYRSTRIITLVGASSATWSVGG